MLDLKPLHEDLEKIHTVIGAIVNKGNRRGPWAARCVTAACSFIGRRPTLSRHWIALRSIAGRIWMLDSQEEAPTKMSWEQYTKFVHKHKAAYPIRHAEDMRAIQPVTSSAAGSSTDSLVLPLASQGSRDTVESTPEMNTPSLAAAACDLDDSLPASQEDVLMSMPETNGPFFATAEACDVGGVLPASQDVTMSNVPSLMIAETFGAEGGCVVQEQRTACEAHVHSHPNKPRVQALEGTNVRCATLARHMWRVQHMCPAPGTACGRNTGGGDGRHSKQSHGTRA